MLEGITILSEKVVDIINFNYMLFFGGLIVGIIIWLAIIAFGTRSDWNDFCIGALGLIIFGIIVISCLANSFPKIGEYTEYKITISDDVNYKEFRSKYIVYGQEGEIYTIREKDAHTISEDNTNSN